MRNTDWQKVIVWSVEMAASTISSKVLFRWLPRRLHQSLLWMIDRVVGMSCVSLSVFQVSRLGRRYLSVIQHTMSRTAHLRRLSSVRTQRTTFVSWLSYSTVRYLVSPLGRRH